MRRGMRGFTLLELMVVLMVLGILTAIGIPSFAYLASSTKLKTATSNLHLALMKARSEAVKRDRPVVIVPNSGSDWTSGWKICVNACPADASDPAVLAVQGALPQVAIVGGPASITYQGSGRTNASPVNFNIAPAPRNASEQVNLAQARCISLLANGSPFLREAACT